MKTKQNGFAVIESLLILIIIAIIGGTGYFVWHSKNQTDKTLNAAGNSTPTLPTGSKPAASTAKFLVIKEWGVKVPILKGDEGLSYKLDSDGLTARIRNAALDNLSGDCTDNSVVILRGQAGDPVYGESGSIGTFSEIYKNPGDSLSSIFTAHIGDYYYLNAPVPTGSCVDLPQTDPQGQKAQDAEDAARTNIFNALKKIIAS